VQLFYSLPGNTIKFLNLRAYTGLDQKKNKLKEPFVSIALCTYNGEKYIEDQLSSILNQSHSNLEVIICDDRSQDNTLSILKDLASKDSRIHVFANVENLGFNKNFEKAISLTSGDFIAISDQDDIWMPSKIQDLLSCIGDKWLVFSNSAFIAADSTIEGKLLFNFRPEGLSYKSFLFNNLVTGHTTLFRKEYLSYLLPIPELGYYDWYMGFVACYHNQITYCDKVLTRYRIHPGSVIQKRESEVRSEINKGEVNFWLIYKQLKAFLS
jgi:glycosyltransferase involved in cell wall biosynthesis